MTDRMQSIIRQKTEKKTLFFAEMSFFCRGVYLAAALYNSST
jgi:hypothetical protein